jgi:hypothetical protein
MSSLEMVGICHTPYKVSSPSIKELCKPSSFLPAKIISSFAKI